MVRGNKHTSASWLATFQVFALALCTFWLAAGTFAAQGLTMPGEETEEQRYWKKQRQREAAEAGAEESLRQSRREQVKARLPQLIEEGRAVQSEILATEEAVKPPVKPGMLDGKGDYVAFGIASALLALLTACVLLRHGQEAEIRALAGGYLSDGTEVAKFKMPEIFAPAFEVAPLLVERADDDEGAPEPDPRDAFFGAFPEYMEGLREALQELGRTTIEAERQKLLCDMVELIAAFKVESNLWQLRPIMQVSTVLELLLQRLADKPRDISASALRTVAGALDLLARLAVRDLRPDLLMMPPLEILAVDDDPLCLRALQFAFQKANLAQDIARNGKEAVALAKTKPYDVVFMDIEMPEMDGFAATAELHQTHFNANTPVVFVTAHSDFQTRAQSTLVGGRDFMAKPFLIFELTVKAITYAAHKRLQPTQSHPRAAVPVSRFFAKPPRPDEHSVARAETEQPSTTEAKPGEMEEAVSVK